MLAAEQFRFLNEVHDLAGGGWDDSSRAKLWRYNLHYFDDLNAHGGETRRAWHAALMQRWVSENPAGQGTAWEPYPTSLRIVNWIKWSLSGGELSPKLLQSLAIQARWLTRRLEIHILANHLFANAKALVFAGLFFEGAEADAWLAKGLRILRHEIPEQILGDGGQFERSTMYHALALEDMLDLVNVTGAFAQGILASNTAFVMSWREAVGRMRAWLATMCHPDGQIAFFNDAAIGIAPSPAELERYAVALDLGVTPLPRDGVTYLADSGYVRIQHGAAVTLIDVAPVGPDYLPGHAHADTLSFECSLFGRRVFVNSGTSCYGGDAERLRQRGTAAHNTVTIGTHDSSEVWGGFRVARRARVSGVAVTDTEAIVVRAVHNGYTRLASRPVHARTWMADDHSLTITDEVKPEQAGAEARLHVHPDVRVGNVERTETGGTVTLTLAGGQAICLEVMNGRVEVAASTWHPEFGISLPSTVVRVWLGRGPLKTRISWSRIP